MMPFDSFSILSIEYYNSEKKMEKARVERCIPDCLLSGVTESTNANVRLESQCSILPLDYFP